jgi:hypothetical protein
MKTPYLIFSLLGSAAFSTPMLAAQNDQVSGQRQLNGASSLSLAKKVRVSEHALSALQSFNNDSNSFTDQSGQGHSLLAEIEENTLVLKKLPDNLFVNR